MKRLWRLVVAAAKAVHRSFGDAHEARVLPIDDKVNASLAAELEATNKRLDGLTELMRAAAVQLNHNTTTLSRWARSVPVITQVERAHYQAEKIRETRKSKRSTLVVPDSTIEVVSAIGGIKSE